MVTSQERPQNSPLYSVNIGLDSFILFNDETFSEQVTLTKLMADREEEENETEASRQFSKPENYSKQKIGLELKIIHPLLLSLENQEISPQRNEEPGDLSQIQQISNLQEQFESTLVEEDSNQTDEPETTPLWSMNFDGSCTKRNAGAGIWIHNTENNHTEGYSYRLKFQCLNNIAEYESLILGLHLLKKLGAKRIKVHGDSELIVRQVNGEYSAKHPRLRAYRNDVMDLLKTFEESQLIFVPREKNILAHSLAFVARTCLTPFETK